MEIRSDEAVPRALPRLRYSSMHLLPYFAPIQRASFINKRGGDAVLSEFQRQTSNQLRKGSTRSSGNRVGQECPSDSMKITL
ncbi:hypothetical protein PHLCEN_2v12013 [Hermanssonia centrifuga]|uniref:Uncharacterized protein n=1 Tax=Hermanssonia centrifuga TaxID=98765 RepID=A0A1U7KT05_9APHY|nr:hypothetical protein PHLCEN_2v12013 [Hermanssonia centrifuga]